MHFLRLCSILEPMQELMSRSKSYGLSPRESLKSVLHNKWQRIQQQQQQQQTGLVNNSNNGKIIIFSIYKEFFKK